MTLTEEETEGLVERHYSGDNRFRHLQFSEHVLQNQCENRAKLHYEHLPRRENAATVSRRAERSGAVGREGAGRPTCKVQGHFQEQQVGRAFTVRHAAA